MSLTKRGSWDGIGGTSEDVYELSLELGSPPIYHIDLDSQLIYAIEQYANTYGDQKTLARIERWKKENGLQ